VRRPGTGPLLVFLVSHVLSIFAAGPGAPAFAGVHPAPTFGEKLYVHVSDADSLRLLETLRHNIQTDRADLESRRLLADLLADCPSIEARREAAEALEEALRVTETDVDIWIRLARLRQRQRFLGESRRAYRRVLELAPGAEKAWDELAAQELRRFQRFDSDAYLESADETNRTALALAPGNLRAIRRQLRIEYMAGREAGVDSLARLWRRAAPEDPWPRLIRGLLHAGRGEFNRAERAFRGGVARLDSLDRVHFETLATIDPDADLLSSESPDSARFVRDYWRWRDPTPADGVNQRLLEHYARLVAAELAFALEDRGLRGWDHAPGRALVRYGVPRNWKYSSGVNRAEAVRISARSSYAPSAVSVRYGTEDVDLTFRFIDFAMNGVYVHEPNAFSGTDRFLDATPNHYELPFEDPVLHQDVEVLRFVDRTGDGRIEVAVALPDDVWANRVLDEPERLVSKIALYDQEWVPREQALEDWTRFRRDEDGRLIALWRLPGTADSAVVGLETMDLDGEGRAAQFHPIPPLADPGEGILLSDVAFLREVGFDEPESPYARADGAAIPNPGHRYAPGEDITVAFEAYHLSLGETGGHRARVRVSVGKPSRRGLRRIVLGRGGDTRNELVFVSERAGSRLEQLLGLALPVLEEGDYVLRIEVEDLDSGATGVTRALFEIKARSGWTE